MMSRKFCLWLAGIVYFVLASATFAQSNDCDSVDATLDKAQHQFDNKAYKDALLSYSCMVQADSLNDMAHIGRLESALLTGDYLTAYGEAFLLDDSSPAALGKAISSLNDQITAMPDAANLYKLRAFIAIFNHQPDIALADADWMIQSDDSFGYLMQAAAQELMGETDKSAKAFNAATKNEPDNAQIYGLMAAVQFSTFNIAGMTENSSRAIKLAPDLAHLYRLHGLAQRFAGDPKAALADANQAIKLDPTFYLFYNLRAGVELALNDPQTALVDYDTVIKLNPRSQIGYALRAGVKLALGNPDAAAQDYAISIAMNTLETIDGEPLTINTPMVLRMTNGRTYHLPFEGHTGKVVTFSVSSVAPDTVDTVILLVSPDGKPLVFNDDANDETLTSELTAYQLSQDGIYTLVVSHANGGSEGKITVLAQLS